MKRLTLMLMASIVAASAAYATTYVRVEKDGTKTYSDRPIPGGQPVELQPVQTYSAPAAKGNPDLPAEQRLLQNIDDFMYTSCSMTPANDSTFTNPENVPIAVTTNPSLRPGDSVQLSIDGQAIPGSESLSYLYAPAIRGSHTVRLSIKDGYGRELCNSSVTFHVFRPSVNSPRRR